MRRALAALVALGTVIAGLASAGPADAGTEPQGANAAPALTLLSQPAWTPLGGELSLVLNAQNVPADVGVRYSLYGSLTRSAFDETLTGNGLGSALSRSAPVNYASLPDAPGGGKALFVDLQSPTGPGDPAALPATSPGVYPLAIDLIDAGGAVLDGFVTYLVALDPDTDQERLRVAWVWPLQTAPVLRADGSADRNVVQELSHSGRIGRQVRVLADTPGAEVTLAPGPETTDAWAHLAETERRLRSGIDNLVTVARRNEVLAGPYVTLDYPAIVAGGLGDRVGPELIEGTSALDRRLPTSVDGGIAIVRPVSQTALEQLRALGIDRVFLDAGALAPPPEAANLTPARPFVLQVDTEQAIEAAASDPVLEAILVGDEPAALRAQQLLAALSIVAIEAPNVVRGLPLVNPSDWDPQLQFLEAVLEGLTDHPVLQPIAASDYFDIDLEPGADGAGILVRELAPAPPPDDPPVTAEAYYRAHAEQDAFRRFLGVGDEKLDPGDRALHVALSAYYQNEVGGRLEAASQLNVVAQNVAKELALIRVPDEGTTVTLTAQEGDVPVTFLNDTGGEVSVRVQLESQELQFPEGTEREVDLPPRSHTVRFAVEARAPGNYPLTLNVNTVEGDLPVSSTRVNVRSTFVSGMGKFLTIGAAVFLVLWWALDIRRRRKRARAAATPA
jgi:hypothetical protein